MANFGTIFYLKLKNNMKIIINFIDLHTAGIDADSVDQIVRFARNTPEYKEWYARQADPQDHDIYFTLAFGYETVTVGFD